MSYKHSLKYLSVGWRQVQAKYNIPFCEMIRLAPYPDLVIDSALKFLDGKQKEDGVKGDLVYLLCWAARMSCKWHGLKPDMNRIKEIKEAIKVTPGKIKSFNDYVNKPNPEKCIEVDKKIKEAIKSTKENQGANIYLKMLLNP